MFALLSQRRLRWLGHVTHVQDGRILKDILYGELTCLSRPAGRPMLRFQDVCKRDLKAGNIIPADLEVTAADRGVWKLAAKTSVKVCERRTGDQCEEKRERRRQRAESKTDAGFTFTNCNRLCRSRIGIFSHST